jgi:hypothetical protein
MVVPLTPGTQGLDVAQAMSAQLYRLCTAAKDP